MIEVKKEIGIPKYKQIINAIESAIENGLLKKGDQLPSINTIKNNNKLSRDTVLMAFNELKNRGIIESIVGKGYYVLSEDINVHQKIFLLFDELNSFKEDLYNSFLENLEDTVQVDIFFHHFNEAIFKKLIKDNAGSYNYYVIMPANLENTSKSIQLLPDDKVYILDQVPEDLAAYPSIYQNFEKSIYENLTKALGFVSKYNKINLIFSEEKQPKGILKGFTQFCEQSAMPFEILSTVKEAPLIKNELYVLLDDISLLRIIKKMKSQNMTLVNDIGVISYNDTLLKEIVEGGITTITTDFNEMGKRLAKMILNKEQGKIENPNKLIIRNSI
ncbi:transcriptional regulator [Polaribacter sejongensis]|uniref:Transcriptional regulator n=1 Tax=Polaribacter sejongensis TaxID=985043 RepID=A0AAJ1QV57_9FLAO|nr:MULTISPECIES: GntR family transcriptional regulator [Polaribacter]AUC21979.1 transcriptional regulator [Polaribacter sejongensis]MDN3618630.1 GntR family transcriptional regulator [Polaribacter undariae]UWD30389.1 GntR family transcriptional regulator [Polaribacter undariae]